VSNFSKIILLDGDPENSINFICKCAPLNAILRLSEASPYFDQVKSPNFPLASFIFSDLLVIDTCTVQMIVGVCNGSSVVVAKLVSPTASAENPQYA